MSMVSMGWAVLAASGFWNGFLLVLFGLVSFLLIGLVLLQKAEGGGLAGAFGGGGSADSVFGVHAMSSIKKMTAVIAAVFFLLAILIAWLPRTVTTDRSRDKAPIVTPEDGAGNNGGGQ